jgi:hypothetical protein
MTFDAARRVRRPALWPAITALCVTLAVALLVAGPR